MYSAFVMKYDNLLEQTTDYAKHLILLNQNLR